MEPAEEKMVGRCAAAYRAASRQINCNDESARGQETSRALDLVHYRRFTIIGREALRLFRFRCKVLPVEIAIYTIQRL